MTSFRPDSSELDDFRKSVKLWNIKAAELLGALAGRTAQILDPDSPDGLHSLVTKMAPPGAAEAEWPVSPPIRGPEEEIPKALRLGSFFTLAKDAGGRVRASKIPAMADFICGRNLIVDADHVPDELAETLFRNLVFRIMLSIRGDRFHLFLLSPNQAGRTFAGLPGADSNGRGLPNVTTLSDPRAITEALLELQKKVRKVTLDLLKGDYGDLRDYLQTNDSIERLVFVFLDGREFQPDDKTLAGVLKMLLEEGPLAGVQLALLVGEQFWEVLNKLGIVRPEAINILHQEGAGDILLLQLSCLSDSGHENGLPFVLDPTPEGADLRQTLEELVGQEAEPKPPLPISFQEIIPKSVLSVSAQEGLRAPIGFRVSTDGRPGKEQYFEIGDKPIGGLIVGRSGTGKSNLLHVLIGSLCARYSPDELQLVLIDLKGVEFEEYSGRTDQQPLAQVSHLASESAPEFGLAAVEYLLGESRRRNDLFTDNQVQNISGFRNKRRGTLPRILAIIDEYQVLFQNKSTSDRAAQSLAALAREGRSVGIHLLLCTQTLSGMGEAAAGQKQIESQLSLRIAFASEGEDSYRVLGDEDASRIRNQGEAIYKDLQAGERGHLFRVPLADSDSRASLRHRVYEEVPDSGRPFIFNGRRPPALADNQLFSDPRRSLTDSMTVWLGQPVGVEDPLEVRFEKARGNHLALVGAESDAALGVLQASLLALVRQMGSKLRVKVMGLSRDGEWAEIERRAVSHGSQLEVVSEEEFLHTLNGWVSNQHRPNNGRELLLGANLDRITTDLAALNLADLASASVEGCHAILWWPSAQTFKGAFTQPQRVFENVLAFGDAAETVAATYQVFSSPNLGERQAWAKVSGVGQKVILPYTVGSIRQFLDSEPVR